MIVRIIWWFFSSVRHVLIVIFDRCNYTHNLYLNKCKCKCQRLSCSVFVQAMIVLEKRWHLMCNDFWMREMNFVKFVCQAYASISLLKIVYNVLIIVNVLFIWQKIWLHFTFITIAIMWNQKVSSIFTLTSNFCRKNHLIFWRCIVENVYGHFSEKVENSMK